MKRLVLPRLYVILDPALLTIPETDCAQQLAAAGVRLLQYRNKQASARELFESSQRLTSLLVPQGVTFVVNDRADVARAVEASGVHVGQEDLEPEDARLVMGREKLVGVSAHNEEQFRKAAATSADYLAIGPIFPTYSKSNPDRVVGLEMIRRVRALTKKPMVAIGGITLDRAAEVVRAGADTVAVISDILRAPDPGKRAKQFLDILGAADPAAAGGA